MNAKIRKFDYLTKSEQMAIKKELDTQYTRALLTEEADLQEIWIKLAIIILHDNFGFDESKCTQFLGDWKGIYRKNGRLETKDAQTEWLAGKMNEIFPNGFPQYAIDKMKEWRG